VTASTLTAHLVVSALLTIGTDGGGIDPARNSLEGHWAETTPSIGVPGMGQPDSGGLEAAVPSTPTCADAPDDPTCRAVRLCEPDSKSATGYAWQAYGHLMAGSLSECTPAEAQGPQVTPGRVLSAFRRIPLPAGKLSIQPPGGKTLVNFDTIFSTTAEDLTRTIRLLGHRVDLRISPTAYVWKHGDDTSQTTDGPGRPYEQGVDMEEYVTHQYTDADVTVRPSVDVTYGATYRVDGGPWQDVVGTVTITGPTAQLRIVEAKPVLTG